MSVCAPTPTLPQRKGVYARLRRAMRGRERTTRVAPWCPMHLKLDPSGPIDSGEVARDLGQESADIVVLSAADNELAVFAAARALLPADFPSVQFTNFLALGHPMSVDAYVERTLDGSEDRGAARARRRGLLAAWRREPACRCTAARQSRSRACRANCSGTRRWRRAAPSRRPTRMRSGAIAPRAASRTRGSRSPMPRT